MPDRPPLDPKSPRAAAALAFALVALGAQAQPRDGRHVAGDFDYYVLALSWNASWCLAEGDARDAPQCDPRENYGFTVHGLWPQYERGWPEFCSTTARDPSRRETAAMADVMASPGLAWGQWKKHGRCSGEDPADYFAAIRRAWASINRPDALRRLGRDVRVAPGVVEAAFIEANPELEPDGVTVTCRDGMLREVRICMDRTLSPRACAADAQIDCKMKTVYLPSVR